MEQVLRYSLPVFHPVIVHFPVGFALLSALIALIWLVRDHASWLVAALGVETLAVAGAVAAYLTGETMKRQSEGVPIVDELVRVHENAALVAIWASGFALLALLGAFLHTRSDVASPGTRRWIRFAAFLLVLAGALAVGWTAHIGGIMVWGAAS